MITTQRRTGCRRLFLALAALTAFRSAHADPFDRVAENGPAKSRSEAPARPTFAIPRASGEIRVDGLANEAAWEGSLLLELPYETDPGENTPAAPRTRCLLTHDLERFYFACRADDPAPASIRARYSDRDDAFEDDFLGVKLDTFNDERRAFQFFVNPLGVQLDVLEDDVNDNEDSAWDAIWHSAGRITSSGYEVEVAIPFTSLRFQSGAGEQTWGLDLVRWRPRDRRVRTALSARLRGVNCEICQMSKVTGFVGATPGRNLEVAPTITASRTAAIAGFPDGGLTHEESDLEPGLTVRWGPTPSITLSGAANPDFSQVEADSARLDVNEQFALFYEEKRPFFLEGADFFDTPINAFYSRTIADPAWGLKVSGKPGKNALGALVARDEITNLIFPGIDGSALGTLPEENLSGVLRYRRDLGRASTVGALVTTRNSGSYSNLVTGVDATLRPTSIDTFFVQALHTETTYPDSIQVEFGQPGGTLRDEAVTIDYRHEPRDWLARASYADYGTGVRVDSGFVPQVGFRRAVAGGGWRWYGDTDSAYSRIEVEADWDQTEDAAGNLIERELEGWFAMNAGRESEVVFGGGTRTYVFNQAPFDQRFVHASLELNATRDVRIEIEAAYGDRVDESYRPAPGVARQGRQFDVSPGIRWNFGRHVRLVLSHSYRTLELIEGRLFEANLSELRLVYQMNVRAFARLITQYSNVAFDPSLSSQPPRSRDLFSQILVSYKLNPQTAIYVGATEGRADGDGTTSVEELVPTSRALFVKLGYAWVP